MHSPEVQSLLFPQEAPFGQLQRTPRRLAYAHRADARPTVGTGAAWASATARRGAARGLALAVDTLIGSTIPVVAAPSAITTHREHAGRGALPERTDPGAAVLVAATENSVAAYGGAARSLAAAIHALARSAIGAGPTRRTVHASGRACGIVWHTCPVQTPEAQSTAVTHGCPLTHIGAQPAASPDTANRRRWRHGIWRRRTCSRRSTHQARTGKSTSCPRTRSPPGSSPKECRWFSCSAWHSSFRGRGGGGFELLRRRATGNDELDPAIRN